MSKIRLILILVMMSIVVASVLTYFNKTKCSIMLQLKGDPQHANISLTHDDVENITLERMPYSTPKNEQYEMVIRVNNKVKPLLHSFTSKNEGKTMSLHFCNYLYGDIAIAAPVDELRMSLLNLDIKKLVPQLKKVTNNFIYTK